jgi:hypothetical protein
LPKSEHKKTSRSNQPKPAVVLDQPGVSIPPDASELFFSWWPSSSFPMPWWAELQETFAELFKRAHRLLTLNGFLVVADPYNESGDGRIWRLTCKSAHKLPKGAVAADLARDCLGSGHVEVQAVKIKGSMLHVYLCPPATMEDRLRDAWRLAKNSLSLAKSLPSAEHGHQRGERCGTARSSNHRDLGSEAHVELGRWADERLREARRFTRLVRGGRPPESLRVEFPALFADVIDRLQKPTQDRLFESAQRQLMTNPDLMDFIADVKQLKGPTLSGYRKTYRREAKTAEPTANN